MAEMSVNVEKREAEGKNAARRLRAAGRIPGILYGDGKEPVPLVADPELIEGILGSPTGVNSIFDLELAGTSQRRPVMIHDYDRHPVSQALVHVDFMRVNMAKKTRVKVHMKLEGLPYGVKNQGGILEFLHRELAIECLPGDIPREIPVDVSELHINQSVRVRELKLDVAKYRILDDGDTVIAVVAVPAAEESAAATTETAAAPAAEPEVIKKGKEKAEDGAAAPAGDKKGEAKPAAKPAAKSEKK